MPVYLLHGFRWPRALIRIHIILQNLDDAAAEWLVAPGTTQTMLHNFTELYPRAMKHLPQLRFVEQHDANDLSATAASQPYAYVADVVEEVRLGVDVDDMRSRGVGSEQRSAMQELRDKIAPGTEEKVGWYVVVCGDEDRWAPPADDCPPHKAAAPEAEPRGFKKFFSSSTLKGRKSRANSAHRSSVPSFEQAPPPALPGPVDASPPPQPPNLSKRQSQMPGGTASDNANGAPRPTPTVRHTSTAQHLSAPPATPTRRAHDSGYASPARRHARTPDTEASISPMPQDSDRNSWSSSTYSTSSRSVSPIEVRRPLTTVDRLRHPSPATAPAGKHFSTATIAPTSHPLSQSQEQEELEELEQPKVLASTPADMPPRTPKSVKRSSLLDTSPEGPSFKDQEEDFDVITMSPSHAPSPAKSQRHSRAPTRSTSTVIASTRIAPLDAADPPPIRTAIPTGSRRIASAPIISAPFDGRPIPSMPGATAHDIELSAPPPKAQIRPQPGPPLDAVAEGTNPAVYMPTKGNGVHDPRLRRVERSVSQTRTRTPTPTQAKENAPQNSFHFAMVASNIENAFDAMR